MDGATIDVAMDAETSKQVMLAVGSALVTVSGQPTAVAEHNTNIREQYELDSLDMIELSMHIADSLALYAYKHKAGHLTPGGAFKPDPAIADFAERLASEMDDAIQVQETMGDLLAFVRRKYDEVVGSWAFA